MRPRTAPEPYDPRAFDVTGRRVCRDAPGIDRAGYARRRLPGDRAGRLRGGLDRIAPGVEDEIRIVVFEDPTSTAGSRTATAMRRLGSRSRRSPSRFDTRRRPRDPRAPRPSGPTPARFGLVRRRRRRPPDREQADEEFGFSSSSLRRSVRRRAVVEEDLAQMEKWTREREGRTRRRRGRCIRRGRDRAGGRARRMGRVPRRRGDPRRLGGRRDRGRA